MSVRKEPRLAPPGTETPLSGRIDKNSLSVRVTRGDRWHVLAPSGGADEEGIPCRRLSSAPGAGKPEDDALSCSCQPDTIRDPAGNSLRSSLSCSNEVMEPIGRPSGAIRVEFPETV